MTTTTNNNGVSVERRTPSPAAYVEDITPAAAAEYLKNLHPSQRHLRERQVAEYIRTLKSKAGWPLQADAITFDKLGRLMNGQHRLTACVRSGIGFRALVLRGAPEESMAVIDIGSNVRSTEFIATSLGSKVNAPRGAHTALALELVDFEYYRQRTMSKKEIIDLWMDSSDELKRVAASLMGAFKRQRGSKAAVAAGIRAWKARPDTLPFLIDAFKNQPGGHPTGTLLHNSLQQNGRNLSAEMSLDHAWFVFRAIVAWERNEPLRVLRGPMGPWPVEQRTLAGVRHRTGRLVWDAPKENGQ